MPPPEPPARDRRRGPDRRRALAHGGRRITDLYTHPEEYVTVQAFAGHLGVQDKTVMKWIHAGLLTAYQFPPEKAGGELRIRKHDAVVFVERARIKPAPLTERAGERQGTTENEPGEGRKLA